jgi:hypothetical protein
MAIMGTHLIWENKYVPIIRNSEIAQSSVSKIPSNSSTYRNRFGITNNQAQHTLGLGHPALPHQENPLPFFSLLATFPVEHPTHNREVCGWNRAA